MLHEKRFIWVLCFAALVLCAGASAEDAKFDAIYNHDFTMGMAGWDNWAPNEVRKGLKMSISTTQYAHLVDKTLIVKKPKLASGQWFEVFSPFELSPEVGKTYTMLLTAKGKGYITIGAIEYGLIGKKGAVGSGIYHNMSELYTLTDEYKTYKFEYTPTPGLKDGMRPSIGFYLPENIAVVDVDASIKSFSMPVSEADYKAICKKHLNSETFLYKGFSAKELAEIKQTGIVDMVLPPFKPIKKAGEKSYKLTTSEITLGKNGLPAKVNVLGKDILSKGIKLAMTYSDGTQLDLYPVESPAKSSEQKVVLNQEFRNKDKQATLSCELNYDAFMIYTLTLKKASEAQITDVSLVIPFTPETAQYIRYEGMLNDWIDVGNFIYGFGPIPKIRERVITRWNMADKVWNDWRPPIPSETSTGDIIFDWKHKEANLTHIWIGDDKRGMSLMCGTDQGYNHKSSEVPAVSLSRNKSEVSLKFNIINGVTSLDKDRTIQFVLAVTPSKPARKDWFDLRFNNVALKYNEEYEEKYANSGITASQPYNYNADLLNTKPWNGKNNRNYRDDSFLWFNLWGVGCSSPLVKDSEALKAYLKYANVTGRRLLPYMAATHLAPEDKNCFYYAVKKGEWNKSNARKVGWVQVCPNSLAAEYMAHGVGKLIDDYGIEGIYFDNCALPRCSNTKHGCGYYDDKGKLKSTMPILGLRKLFMMVRHEFIKRGKKPFIYCHAGLTPALASFIDVHLAGEGIYGNDYTEMVSLGEWRARFLGPNQFGTLQVYCPNFHYRRPLNMSYNENIAKATRTFLTMAVLHGTKVQKTIVDQGLLHRVWQVYDELQGEVEFIPYWHWDSVNKKLNLRNVYASAYSQGNRMILAVSNLSKTPQKVSIPLAEIQKKNSAVKNVADNLHKKPVAIKNGQILLTIPPEDFRLFSLY